jgi:L-lactate utilization protein LutB
MESTTEAKPKRQMTPEQLEKLKLAREKALQKKREIKEIKDGEKAIKQKELEDRKKRVKEFAKLTSPKAEFKKSMPPAHVEQ